MPIQSRPGFVPVVIAAILLLQLAAVYALLTADHDTVYVDGRPIHVACSFKQHFGIPCPACGMSRSVVLTLHGDVGTASSLNPGGPLGVLLTLYFSAAMLWLGLRRSDRTVRVIQWSTACLGMVLIAVMCVHWVAAVSEARHNGAHSTSAVTLTHR
jgi:hypothetical protein